MNKAPAAHSDAPCPFTVIYAPALSKTRRLEAFLEGLHPGYRYAFEFRDSIWFDPRAYDALGKHGATFCIYDFAGRLSPKKVTSGLIYIRLHGPCGPYQGQYATDQLAGWADDLLSRAKEGKELYCYFDNDQAGYAAQDALRLKAMIENEALLISNR